MGGLCTERDRDAEKAEKIGLLKHDFGDAVVAEPFSVPDRVDLRRPKRAVAVNLQTEQGRGVILQLCLVVRNSDDGQVLSQFVRDEVQTMPPIEAPVQNFVGLAAQCALADLKVRRRLEREQGRLKSRAESERGILAQGCQFRLVQF
jgi:hypothetical protein